jgi:ACS family hexuronate transporter-like MFS transporter
VGAAIGSIVGGIYAGRLMHKGKTLNYARKKAITIGGVIMFAGLLSTILFANTPLKFVLIVAFVLFGFQFTIGNIQTIPSDLFSGKSVGTLAGFGGSVGVFSVIIMNFLVPFISRISYIPIFIMIAIFVPLGVLAVYLLAGRIQPVEVKYEEVK